MKKDFIECKFTIEVSTKFRSYDTPAKNKKAIKYIQRYATDSIKNNYYFPIYVEKDGFGGPFEDATQRIKVRIKE